MLATIRRKPAPAPAAADPLPSIPLPSCEGLDKLPHDEKAKATRERYAGLKTDLAAAQRGKGTSDAQILEGLRVRERNAVAGVLAGQVTPETLDNTRKLLKDYEDARRLQAASEHPSTIADAMERVKAEGIAYEHERHTELREEAFARCRLVMRRKLALQRALKETEDRERELANAVYSLTFDRSAQTRLGRIREEVAREGPSHD